MPHRANGELPHAIDTREALGFDASESYIDSLVITGADVGTDEYGFPMDDAELEEFERRGEMQEVFFAEMREPVVATPGYSTHYFDHENQGNVVILTTGDPAEFRNALDIPPSLEGRVTVAGTNNSDDELSAYRDDLRVKLEQNFGHVAIHSIGIDVKSRGLIVTVDDEHVTSLSQAAATWSESTGVPVEVVAGKAPEDAVCTSRDNCHTPMRAGNRIDRGSTGQNCTMGFHVTVGGTRQFLTSGHCGAGSGSTLWYHDGYGLVGGVQASIYWEGGIDAMRVLLPGGQVSNSIYHADYVSGVEAPVYGTEICVSRGENDSINCGTVTVANDQWTSSTCGCTVIGARSSLVSIGGDSGSPIYSYHGTRAMGLMATTSGRFAIVWDVLDEWNASIYT